MDLSLADFVCPDELILNKTVKKGSAKYFVNYKKVDDEFGSLYGSQGAGIADGGEIEFRPKGTAAWLLMKLNSRN